MNEELFADAQPHPAVPELGRAIYLEVDAPSGSPANYEELNGCPVPGGWSAYRSEHPVLSADKQAAALDELAVALRSRLVDLPLPPPPPAPEA